MDTNQYLRGLLLRNFEQIKSRNPRYSLRKYAKDLELSSGALSEFLNDQRSFTGSTIMKIFSKLKISEIEIIELETSFATHSKPDKSSLNLPFKLLLNEKGAAEVEQILGKLVSKIFRLSMEHSGPIEIDLHIAKKTNRNFFPEGRNIK